MQIVKRKSFDTFSKFKCLWILTPGSPFPIHWQCDVYPGLTRGQTLRQGAETAQRAECDPSPALSAPSSKVINSIIVMLAEVNSVVLFLRERWATSGSTQSSFLALLKVSGTKLGLAILYIRQVLKPLHFFSSPGDEGWQPYSQLYSHPTALLALCSGSLLVRLGTNPGQSVQGSSLSTGLSLQLLYPLPNENSVCYIPKVAS